MGNDAWRVAVVNVCRGFLVQDEERDGSYTVTSQKVLSFSEK
jgi:hypothetical protein